MRSGCFALSWINIFGACGSQLQWLKHSASLSYAESSLYEELILSAHAICGWQSVAIGRFFVR